METGIFVLHAIFSAAECYLSTLVAKVAVTGLSAHKRSCCFFRTGPSDLKSDEGPVENAL